MQVYKSVAGTRLGAGTYGCLVDLIGADGNDTLLQLDHGSYSFGALRLRNDSTGTVTLGNSANGPPSITVEGNLTFDNSDAAGAIVIDDSGRTVDWNIKGNVVTTVTGTNFTWTPGNGRYYVNGSGNQQIAFDGFSTPPLTIDKPSGNVELVEVDLTLAQVPHL